MLPKIILASQSPRRKQLLEWAEIPFEIIVQHTDENYPSHIPQDDVPVYIAHQKALAVQNYLAEQKNNSLEIKPILAADTVVILDNKIIGKPATKNEAVNTLKLLSGQQHKVITGVVILHGEKEISFSDTTFVHFHPLTNEQIEFYVDKYKPYDKAGAYAIQEWIGVIGIKSMNGDFYNVMGLPVSKVVQQLMKFKIINPT